MKIIFVCIILIDLALIVAGFMFFDIDRNIDQLQSNQVILFNQNCQLLNKLHEHYGSKCREVK